MVHSNKNTRRKVNILGWGPFKITIKKRYTNIFIRDNHSIDFIVITVNSPFFHSFSEANIEFWLEIINPYIINKNLVETNMTT